MDKYYEIEKRYYSIYGTLSISYHVFLHEQLDTKEWKGGFGSEEDAYDYIKHEIDYGGDIDDWN